MVTIARRVIVVSKENRYLEGFAALHDHVLEFEE
jgi:hypothetical protein